MMLSIAPTTALGVSTKHTKSVVPVSVKTFLFGLSLFSPSFSFSGKAGGNYGIAKLIRPNNENEDLDFLANSGPDAPYVAIINPSQFSNM